MKLKLILLMNIFGLIIGCGALDDSGSSDDSESTSAMKLIGLWIGSSEEQGSTAEIDTQVLFLDETVFVLRDDEAHIGTYMVSSNGSATFETDLYTYNAPDTDNQFYTGSRNNTQFDMDALFATSSDLFINYESTARSGSITLALDNAREDNLTLNRISGQWDTADAIMYINDEGGLQGSNSATGCQWKGNLSTIKNDLLALRIERKLCPDFNQTVGSPVDGFALIDGEGVLHFIAQQPNQFLWMRFDSATTTTTTEETETEETTEEAP